jgi:hypothetical protein
MRTPKMTLADLLREVNVAPQMEDHLARIIFNLGGGRVPMAFSTTVVGSPAAAAETVICTTPPLNPPSDASNIIVIGMYQIQTGTNGTTVNTRIRQGATAAGLVVSGFPGLTVVATQVYTPSILAIDTPGLVAGLQYSMSAQVGAATAVSTVSSLALLAMAIG